MKTNPLKLKYTELENLTFDELIKKHSDVSSTSGLKISIGTKTCNPNDKVITKMVKASKAAKTYAPIKVNGIASGGACIRNITEIVN